MSSTARPIRSTTGGSGRPTATWRWSAPMTARSWHAGQETSLLRRRRADCTATTPSRTPERRCIAAARPGCSSPRPRSSCTGPASGTQGKKKVEIPGPPLPLRLVVTEVRDLKGRVLARWLLLTNVPAALADAATIARWYYFRWRIESLHKLLKSGRLAVGELAAARRPAAADQAVDRLRGVRVDLGVGAAARRGVGGVPGAADATERTADEAGTSRSRPAGCWPGCGCCKARWARWLATDPRDSTPCWKITCPSLRRRNRMHMFL